MKLKQLMFLMMLTAPLLIAQPILEMPPGKWWGNPDVQEKLQLSPQQIKQMDEIMFRHMDSMIDLKADLEKNHLRLKDKLDKDVIIEDEVMKQVNRVLDARNNLERERAGMLVKMRLVLTSEQWHLVKQFLMNKKLDRREQRMNKFRNNRPYNNPQGGPR